ncbi:putative bifunctional diguanylate cyclase/phosphodiesterase [Pseudomonas anguilliseptica]|uniref:putative bifunctional diguanylate cyclase/phosphodiesterase n=1 Tax=Pseudomonas anguilliseptica TaxID=53406 RepID=UPI001F419D95|nr:EAL domain-containing protein [Pseudomonas anguilliseptica]MCE5364890.1 EAL domain-containing protein [Pseudomonas anguilliseptica]
MMLRNSFQARIAGVLVLLLLVVVGALYVAVQAATNAAVRSQANEQLEVGSLVFQRLLEMRGSQLHDAVQVLAADFGFKDAVASGDAETIRSALANHGARINASVVMMLSLDGRLEVSTDQQVSEQTAKRLSAQVVQRQREGVQIFLMPIADKIYLLVQATVTAPLPIARVMMGFQVDTAFAAELRELTHLDLTLLATQEGAADIWISTLMPAEREQLRVAVGGMNGDAIRVLGSQQYLNQNLVLAVGDGFEVRVLLHKSLSQAQLAFAPLDQKILLIALAALTASLAGALLLARTVSQPVQQLAGVAERVRQGDYEAELDLQRSDELGQLAKAFKAMQHGIAERERQLAHNALHDPLTGLPNRTLALERLGSAITAQRSTALLYLGIGNFRAVNESLGPEGGDLALQQMSRRLQATLRPGDSVARIIGDEFLLLLENTDSDSAVGIADKVQQLLLKPLRVGSHDVTLDCRIGIASYPVDGNAPEDLLRRAAIAMQDAAGLASHLQVYQRGRDDAQQRQIRLIRDLRHAASKGELRLHYQPKLDIAAGLVRQAEALLRWQHPALGMVSPGEFIPMAERTGSIQLLTAWVIEEVIRQLREWTGRGLRVQVSLNISTEDLLDPQLPARVRQLLETYQVPAQQLIFEITESGVMLNPEVALQVLHGLRECGVSLSVDDFGTGYSSLAQLKRMPVQELKIDQSFIRDLDDACEDAVIVRSTIEMSHSLGLKVVAEGVEFERSLQLLGRWQCDIAQGYLISRPLAAKAFETWMAQHAHATSSLVH